MTCKTRYLVFSILFLYLLHIRNVRLLTGTSNHTKTNMLIIIHHFVFNLAGWAKISYALDDFILRRAPDLTMYGDCAFCTCAAPVFHSNDFKTFEVYGRQTKNINILFHINIFFHIK